MLQRLGSLKRCDCFGDDRMAGSGRLPAVSGRRHESRDWRIRGLSDRPPRAPAFVLAQAFAAQGVRVAPHLRERHGDFGGLLLLSCLQPLAWLLVGLPLIAARIWWSVAAALAVLW